MSLSGVRRSFSAPGEDSYGQIPVEFLPPGTAFVLCYASTVLDKCLTLAQKNDYLAVGLSVATVWEDNAKDALGFTDSSGTYPAGTKAGIRKGQLAESVLASFEWPSYRPCHFANDFSPVGWEIEACCEASAAFAEFLGIPLGIYGDVNVCSYAYGMGFKYSIQFGEGVAAGRTMYQSYPPIVLKNGQQADPDTALADDYGQIPWEVVTLYDYQVKIEENGIGLRLTNLDPTKIYAPAVFDSDNNIYYAKLYPVGNETMIKVIALGSNGVPISVPNGFEVTVRVAEGTEAAQKGV